MVEKQFGSLANVNVELTGRCNKNCWMCGRRKIERDYPEIAATYGDMDFELVKKIAEQLPDNITVQLHNNGEPLLYPRFGEAAKLFSRQITSIDTNGKLLVEKANEIIGNLDTLAISVIENDSEADNQYAIIEKFLELKGDRKPLVVLRLNGNVDRSRYEKFGLIIATRILHSPLGSFNYKKREPTIPEVGICWDFLNHLVINFKGEVSICVRFDPKGLGVIGNAKKESLLNIWNGEKRMKWLELHKRGRRDQVPLCSYCQFWGIPTAFPSEYKAKKTDEEAKVFEEKTGAKPSIRMNKKK
ncbi:SPASM domain-containing protein [Candidatus Woesearchaeota archaeon]|nr:SPASM domain-containing protein [Candidatus Woesearchaeota archaeon]